MAFITITDTANIIDVDLGVYAGIVAPYKKATFHKNIISFQLAADESFVRVEDRSGQSWTVTFDGNGETLKIDTINAVAAVSNLDLYDKLVLLLG
jgi:hypothetical protein